MGAIEEITPQDDVAWKVFYHPEFCLWLKVLVTTGLIRYSQFPIWPKLVPITYFDFRRDTLCVDFHWHISLHYVQIDEVQVRTGIHLSDY